ncbi:fibronectin type III domain-containing protein [Luteolibacter flavescens]|uniref:Fibronectin type III domain-containing protein n=1 Tax=Luteolibacter flavescens TaxID=1859460 RepID=A0ABT3FMU4_9BACT|nr:fibronectin type III domain-containing protein [Luteolibacter flavescens]MCW1884782.1 fibronectin type III domain-containing protein [Luteolibacter flavescens]
MNRSQFLRLIGFGATGAFVFRPSWALGAIDYDFQGTPAGLRPYLQTPRPDSIWVSWWTNADAQTHVDFGTAADALTRTATSAPTRMGTNYTYHCVRLTGLQPDTYYYYKARTENVTSEVFRFRTPKAIGTGTGKFRVLIIGDNQVIDPAQRRYERLVERAKKKIEDLYSVPIEEAIDLVLMPGDQVDVGTLEHYRHLHFKFCGWISPNIPIMTTIGNHETYSDPGLANYKAIFRYDDLTCAGVSSPDPEVYYAYQLANIAFVHTSSEHITTAQTTWVQDIVTASDSAANVDWMISLCHKPYQAEQYIGDISTWMRNTAMPILAQTQKHVLNIGAHHHLYARGQTRQWPVYHIISGGSAWDQYWGQSNEADYDDVQKTVAHWTWQLVEFDLDARTMDVRCFSEANIRFPTATRWSYNSRLVDHFTRKRGITATPAKPSLTNTFAAPVTLPVELASTAYQTTSGEAMNSTWFQVAADAGFSNLKIDRIRDVENFYGDSGSPLYEPVDTHAGLDILRYTIPASGLPDGTYHARVRHRDANTLWSAWSSAITFTVTGSVPSDPKIALQKSVYPPNEDIPVAFENGTGSTRDWIGFFPKGTTPRAGASPSWFYLNGTRTAPAAAIRNGTLNFTYNLPVGEWFAAFFSADSYTEIAPRVPIYVGNMVTMTPGSEAYDEGETVRINFSGAPTGEKDWIGIYRVGINPGPTPSVSWKYAAEASGFRDFPGLAKGYYYAAFMVNDQYQEIATRVPFSVGSQISTVSMEAAQVQQGSDFTVHFSNGPGIPKDWIGIFKDGEIPGVNVLTSYLYFNGATSGSVTFQLPDLAPGKYFVAMFTNDSYTEVSNRVTFTVQGKAPLEFEQAELEGNQMRLRWKSESGKTYKIQKSTRLDGWEDVRSVTASGASHEELVPVDRIADPKCFFRVTGD